MPQLTDPDTGEKYQLTARDIYRRANAKGESGSVSMFLENMFKELGLNIADYME